MLKYIYENIPTTDFTQNIEENVGVAKAKPVFKDDYMYFCDIVEDEKEKARVEALAEGRKEGRKEGREEGLSEGIEQGLAEGSKSTTLKTAGKMKQKNIAPTVIAECTGLTLEEVANL